MYSRRSNLVIGFHGCDKVVADKLICGDLQMKPSRNEYDWLGNGMYFWEYNEARAYEFASQYAEGHGIKEPAVVGAVLDLGHCLDLMDSYGLQLLQDAYKAFAETASKSSRTLPENRLGQDKVLRYLDCAVIEYLHASRSEAGISKFDSVRAVFEEGSELYPGSAFKEKNHIQICIRNPECIIGFFRPR